MKSALKFLGIAAGLYLVGRWLQQASAPPSRAEAAAALDQFAVDAKYTPTIESLCYLSSVPIGDPLLERVGDELRYMIWRNTPLPPEAVTQRVRQMAAELRGEPAEGAAQPAWDYMPSP